MRNIIVLSFMVFGFAFTSCNSTEDQAESKQSAYSESMDTSEGTEIKEKNSEEKIDEYSEEEDGFEVDSETLSKMDSAANASMEFEPIVANRAAVEKSLKPNKDGVIVLDWNIMNDIKLNECFNETIGEYFWCPDFGSIMKSLAGKTVALKGYVLPLEGNYFVLSVNPMASCYFCGGGGPQSIVDLKFDSPRAFKMDAHLMFKGTLRLNKDNIEELFYVLDDADIYKVK